MLTVVVMVKQFDAISKLETTHDYALYITLLISNWDYTRSTLATIEELIN